MMTAASQVSTIRVGSIVYNKFDGRKARVVEIVTDPYTRRKSIKVQIEWSNYFEWWSLSDITSTVRLRTL